MPLSKDMLLQRLSPFEFARYAGDFPDTRALQIEFGERVKDTYNVYNGGTELFADANDKIFNEFEATTTPGLIDYATLGTFRMVHAIQTGLAKVMFVDFENFNNAHGKKKFKNGFINTGLLTIKLVCAIPYMAATALHVLTNGIIRPCAASILTVASLLPIAIAHGIAKKVRAYKARKLAQIMLQPESLMQPRSKTTTTQNDKTTCDHKRIQDNNLLRKFSNSIANIKVESIEQLISSDEKVTCKVVKFKLPHDSMNTSYYTLFGIKDARILYELPEVKSLETLVKINESARQKMNHLMHTRGSHNNRPSN